MTNHKDLFLVLTAVRARRAVSRSGYGFVADMGGLDRCSEMKLGLLRRLAAATVQAELLEARMVNGEQIDIGQLCTLASTTVRIASRLGVERRAKPRPPTVNDYLEHLRLPNEAASPLAQGALQDPHLLGNGLAGDTWKSWHILLIASDGRRATEDEREIFNRADRPRARA